MDLLKLFTRDEPIAGLEISDSFLRLALLSKEKTKKGEEILKIKALIEKSLKKGDKEEFIAVLNSLLKEISPRVKHAVVSISPASVYSRVYSFPKTLGGEKLEEAMKLTVGFQLPVKLEDVYLDWEKIKEEEGKIFLALAPKRVINGYLEILKTAGLNAVAIEFFPMSASRVIDIKETVLTLLFEKAGITASIIDKNRVVRFIRFIPTDFFNEEEIRKIIDFYEAENKEPVSINKITKIIKPFSDNETIKKDESRWVVVIGAALRGLLPRAEDELVSLMPIGTEEAYENQKALAFSEFLSSVTIGLCVFFIVVFAGVWIFVASLQRGFSARIENLNSLPLPSDAAELQQRAEKFNELSAKVNGILTAPYKWSAILEELKTRTVSGITLTNVSMPSFGEFFSVSGVASNRNQLNLFKKSLEESLFFEGVSLPPTNVAQKENIPFSATFKLK